jgi:hypothetical protein
MDDLRINDARVMDELLTDPFACKLQALAKARAAEYRSNAPYPHIYFDDFLPPAVAEAALHDFPEPMQADWHASTDVNQRKKPAHAAISGDPHWDRGVGA